MYGGGQGSYRQQWGHRANGNYMQESGNGAAELGEGAAELGEGSSQTIAEY